MFLLVAILVVVVLLIVITYTGRLKITDSNYSVISVNFALQLQLSENNWNIYLSIVIYSEYIYIISMFLKTVSNSVDNCWQGAEVTGVEAASCI